MPSRPCLACGQDTPVAELNHGYCERCYKEISAGGGRYGRNTVAVTVVEAMHALGASSVQFDADGTLRLNFYKRADR